jgi:NADPH-dependent F420 reductase
MSPVNELTVGVLGGTGPQGRGLARRWAAAGIAVILGSRDASRAVEAAEKLAGETGGQVTGAANAGAAAGADLVLVAVPWDGHGDLLSSLAGELAGKIVIDCVNPLGFDKQGPYALAVEEGSAAQQAAALLPDSTVVAAFHNVSAVLLDDPEVTSVDTDVLVLGEDREACDTVIELANAIPGVRGLFGGRLRNAHQVEAFTANLIAINRRYQAHAGLRITDVSPPWFRSQRNDEAVRRARG